MKKEVSFLIISKPPINPNSELSIYGRLISVIKFCEALNIRRQLILTVSPNFNEFRRFNATFPVNCMFPSLSGCTPIKPFKLFFETGSAYIYIWAKSLINSYAAGFNSLTYPVFFKFLLMSFIWLKLNRFPIFKLDALEMRFHSFFESSGVINVSIFTSGPLFNRHFI